MKTNAEWIGCKCFFCQEGKEHPKHSIDAGTSCLSDITTKAESLDPADTIKVIACNLCGHKEEGK